MVGVSTKSSRSKAVREFKSNGNKAMAAGAFQKATRLYTKALELDPGNAVLYSNRSAAHFNLRQFAESLEDAESAILCDSMWWKAYKRKGLSLIHMQKYDEAIEALEAGLKIVKKNAEMEKNLEFARACQEQAQNLYILPEPHMMQKLESVPVFIVTDEVGQPFFVTYEDGQQVCTFYFDQVDANATLDWIKSENPELGDTARVIHITLNQAFNLAQETQKQYYEDSTRAAAEEDRRAAEALAKSSGRSTVPAFHDVDDSDDDKNSGSGGEGTLLPEISTEEKPGSGESSQSKSCGEGAAIESTAASAKDPKIGNDTATQGSGCCAKKTCGRVKQAKGDSLGESEKTDEVFEDVAIDENAPLSFQFRPELRQVQIAVELLNKHPDPPVRPILRDPPSVRKAKAEAASVAEVAATSDVSATIPSEQVIDEKKKPSNDSSGSHNEADGCVSPSPEDDTASSNSSGTEPSGKEADQKEVSSKEEVVDASLDDEDIELTVDNFNGIPIFQAKGLTLLQNNEQMIPLFFSKWDLEAAWKQLTKSNTPDVPKECEIDVGTLEDVLRRMSESKTKEFESVFFVPSREAMTAIGAKFPLDDLTAAQPSKSIVKKPTFSRAKQIAAQGGTKDEVRAAIREDLELHVERLRMAEIIAQIEQARRANGGTVNATGARRPGAGRIDRTMRRNAQRLQRKQEAREKSKLVSSPVVRSPKKTKNAKASPKATEGMSSKTGTEPDVVVMSGKASPAEKAPQAASC